MWKQRSGRHAAKDECPHTTTRSSPNSGLEVTVCESCGHVSVRYLHAVIEDDTIVPEPEPVPAER